MNPYKSTKNTVKTTEVKIINRFRKPTFEKNNHSADN